MGDGTTEPTLADVLRALAERRVVHHHIDDFLGTGTPVDAMVPDPRFAALSGEHEWRFAAGGAFGRCEVCRAFEIATSTPPYCLRTDLGAILAAAATDYEAWQLAMITLHVEWQDAKREGRELRPAE